MSYLKEYDERYSRVLVPTAERLELFFKDRICDGVKRLDRVSARAKAPERFAEKATKTLPGSTEPRYKNPLVDIKDQIGVRVVVFYHEDVNFVRSRITEYFKPIEKKSLQPASDDEFGYFGKHFILPMPAEVMPDTTADKTPKHFELQVKTLFQHAWAECNHDIAYKEMTGELDSELRRKIAFAAAQAWGADKIFEELVEALSNKNRAVIS